MPRYYVEIRVYDEGNDYVHDVINGDCRFDVWAQALKYAKKELDRKVKLNLFDTEYPYHDGPWCIKSRIFNRNDLRTTAAILV